MSDWNKWSKRHVAVHQAIQKYNVFGMALNPHRPFTDSDWKRAEAVLQAIKEVEYQEEAERRRNDEQHYPNDEKSVQETPVRLDGRDETDRSTQDHPWGEYRFAPEEWPKQEGAAESEPGHSSNREEKPGSHTEEWEQMKLKLEGMNEDQAFDEVEQWMDQRLKTIKARLRKTHDKYPESFWAEIDSLVFHVLDTALVIGKMDWPENLHLGDVMDKHIGRWAIDQVEDEEERQMEEMRKRKEEMEEKMGQAGPWTEIEPPSNKVVFGDGEVTMDLGDKTLHVTIPEAETPVLDKELREGLDEVERFLSVLGEEEGEEHHPGLVRISPEFVDRIFSLYNLMDTNPAKYRNTSVWKNAMLPDKNYLLRCQSQTLNAEPTFWVMNLPNVLFAKKKREEEEENQRKLNQVDPYTRGMTILLKPEVSAMLVELAKILAIPDDELVSALILEKWRSVKEITNLKGKVR